MDMSDVIRTSATQLKAKLGAFMREVRAGRTVVITDRSCPVARLCPLADAQPQPSVLPLARRRRVPAVPLGKVRVRSIDYAGPSTTEMLADDRRRR